MKTKRAKSDKTKRQTPIKSKRQKSDLFPFLLPIIFRLQFLLKPIYSQGNLTPNACDQGNSQIKE